MTRSVLILSVHNYKGLGTGGVSYAAATCNVMLGHDHLSAVIKEQEQYNTHRLVDLVELRQLHTAMLH